MQKSVASLAGSHQMVCPGYKAVRCGRCIQVSITGDDLYLMITSRIWFTFTSPILRWLQSANKAAWRIMSVFSTCLHSTPPLISPHSSPHHCHGYVPLANWVETSELSNTRLPKQHTGHHGYKKGNYPTQKPGRPGGTHSRQIASVFRIIHVRGPDRYQYPAVTWSPWPLTSIRLSRPMRCWATDHVTSLSAISGQPTGSQTNEVCCAAVIESSSDQMGPGSRRKHRHNANYDSTWVTLFSRTGADDISLAVTRHPPSCQAPRTKARWLAPSCWHYLIQSGGEVSITEHDVQLLFHSYTFSPLPRWHWQSRSHK